MYCIEFQNVMLMKLLCKTPISAGSFYLHCFINFRAIEYG